MELFLKKNVNYTFLFKLLLLSWNFSGLLTRNLIHILPIQQKHEQRACDCAGSVITCLSGFYCTGPYTTIEWSKTYGWIQCSQNRLPQLKPVQKSALLPKEVFLLPLSMELVFWLAAYWSVQESWSGKKLSCFSSCPATFQAGSALWPGPPFSPH